jgi:hypothetical protein
VAIKAGGAVYVRRCASVEVVIRIHRNCTEEIPAIYNGTKIFMNPVSIVIKSAGSLVHCNDLAPPWYKVEGKWFWSYPKLPECQDLAILPVDEVQIELLQMSDIGGGKSIYSKKQIDKLAVLLASQGTMSTYLAKKTAELAYHVRNEYEECTLALGSKSSSFHDRHHRDEFHFHV